MSKRKTENISKENSKIIATEARLLELQTYAYHLIVNTRIGKSDAAKSTRSFADPLLNLEVKMLREKESELTARVKNLEKGKSTSSADEALELLRRENEELRQHLGEVGQQMHIVRAEMQDALIEELKSSLVEAHQTIAALRAEKESQSGDIFNLKARVKDILAGKSSTAGGEGDSLWARSVCKAYHSSASRGADGFIKVKASDGIKAGKHAQKVNLYIFKSAKEMIAQLRRSSGLATALLSRMAAQILVPSSAISFALSTDLNSSIVLKFMSLH